MPAITRFLTRAKSGPVAVTLVLPLRVRADHVHNVVKVATPLGGPAEIAQLCVATPLSGLADIAQLRVARPLSGLVEISTQLRTHPLLLGWQVIAGHAAPAFSR
jgi:hypothetical protein